MLVNFNGNIIQDSELGFNHLYRAAMFGDGVFESIYFENNEIYLFEEHLARLKQGMSCLQLSFPKTLKTKDWLKNFKSLIRENYSTASLRLRIMVWRKGHGTYNTSNKTMANYLIFVEPCSELAVIEIKKVASAKNISIDKTWYSNNKTLSGLNYVGASIERLENNLDEIFIKSKDGHIIEAGSSNIICIKDGKGFQPKKNSGQVKGVMNDFILSYLNSENIKIQESEIRDDNISSFDLIIISNSFIIKLLNNNKESKVSRIIKEIKAYIPKQLLQL